MNLAIVSRFSSVEKIVVAASKKQLDEEVVSNYCKLGAVLVCGAVERSIEILIDERVSQRSAPQVGPFLKNYFKRGTNYTADEIRALLYKFDTTWGADFEELIRANERLKTSLSSCYAIRNSVAHGGTQSLGPRILRQYFEDAIEIISHIEAIIKK